MSFNSFDEGLSFSPEPVKFVVAKDQMQSNHFFTNSFPKCTKPLLANQPRADKDGFKRDTCDNLICSNCNIRVTFFNQSEWKPNCDYLFFRSFFGVSDKLSQGLVSNPRKRAYNCGCQGISIEDALFVEEINGLKWICLGHQN